MTYCEKIERAVQSPAYNAYCTLIAAAILRAVLGDKRAEQEIVDLQNEQQRLLLAAMDAQS